MAKKEKEPEAQAEGEKPEGEGADAAPKKGLGKILGKLKNKKVLMIAVPALLLVLGGAGAGAYFFLFKKSETQQAKAEEVPLTPPKVAFSDMQDILVNIQSNDGTPAYLKLGVSLELEDEAQKTALEPLMPRITDQFQAYLRELRLEQVRASVGLVLQESFLFPFSIAENIAFGRPGVGQEQIEAAARAANAHEFISRLPQGYATVVGERGATLSGGERQRIAIARALLKDAPVLILDEPTSALDVATEASVLEALEGLLAGRTTIIIAHRLSTIRRAQRVIVLDHGRPVETGTPNQLLNRRSHYARLHEPHRDHEAVIT